MLILEVSRALIKACRAPFMVTEFPNTDSKALHAHVKKDASELYGRQVSSLTKSMLRGCFSSDAAMICFTDGGSYFVRVPLRRHVLWRLRSTVAC